MKGWLVWCGKDENRKSLGRSASPWLEGGSGETLGEGIKREREILRKFTEISELV